MKKIVLAALGATLIAGFAADNASAAKRAQPRTDIQAPVQADEGFRNSYNAYGRGYETPAYSGRAVGGTISAPAGR